MAKLKHQRWGKTMSIGSTATLSGWNRTGNELGYGRAYYYTSEQLELISDCAKRGINMPFKGLVVSATKSAIIVRDQEHKLPGEKRGQIIVRIVR